MSGTEIRNLLQEPRWLAAELGAPMPDSVHAASACLPLWDHNIRYEEGDPQVVDRLRAAYPRFCLHPLVRQLCRQVFGSEGTGLVFPSDRIAGRAAEHVRNRGGVVTELVPVSGTAAVGVRVLVDDFGRLKEYWQHAGEIISSRAAESLTAGVAAVATETEARRTVRRRFAEYGGCGEDEAWLFPSGMAAIACVWRAVRRLDPQRPTVQFGFPYVDTLKIQQRFSPQAWRFLPRGDAGDLEQLSQLLRSQSISALFCETPTNPLLTMPDLAALRQLADEHGFLLIVDDTLAAVINDNPLSWADAVATSLTKYFSGQGDVLAGGLRLNRQRPGFQQLQAAVRAEFEELLCDADAEVLERNSRDVAERVQVINRNAAELSERLSRHPAVQQVFYPAVTKGGVGRGGLMSIVLRSAAERTPAVFDRLRVCKGPNLGTSFTLCCPYTILAHYTELDEVEAVGVSRWLLRISVGTEPVEDLWQRFSVALDGV